MKFAYFRAISHTVTKNAALEEHSDIRTVQYHRNQHRTTLFHIIYTLSHYFIPNNTTRSTIPSKTNIALLYSTTYTLSKPTLTVLYTDALPHPAKRTLLPLQTRTLLKTPNTLTESFPTNAHTLFQRTTSSTIPFHPINTAILTLFNTLKKPTTQYHTHLGI